MKICVYCASSRQADPVYAAEAERLGRLLGGRAIEVIYGGGFVGSMGALANGVLATGGRVTGIIPRFMVDLEWGHQDVHELRVVEDMHSRKRMMMEEADAIVALPGGSGTFEELLEAITWKRLALLTCPIIIVNFNGYYDPLIAMLRHSVNQRFMDRRHLGMWSVVAGAEEVLAAIEQADEWGPDARGFAAL